MGSASAKCIIIDKASRQAAHEPSATPVVVVEPYRVNASLHSTTSKSKNNGTRLDLNSNRVRCPRYRLPSFMRGRSDRLNLLRKTIPFPIPNRFLPAHPDTLVFFRSVRPRARRRTASRAEPKRRRQFVENGRCPSWANRVSWPSGNPPWSLCSRGAKEGVQFLTKDGITTQYQSPVERILFKLSFSTRSGCAPKTRRQCHSCLSPFLSRSS